MHGDFLPGAEQLALADHPATGKQTGQYQYTTFATYTVLSTTTSRTAYVQVTGQITYHFRQIPDVTYSTISATPVDSSGNSIGAETESQQESFYTALDGNLWGVSRSEPLEVDCPDAYATSFIGSIDEEIGPAIDQALLAKGINWATDLPNGTIVLVKFSDGTTAVFIKVSSASTDHWVWGLSAHDKNGNPINRQGQLLTNPNTSGTGGGNGDTNSGGFNFLFARDPECYASTQGTLPDGTAVDGGSWGPC